MALDHSYFTNQMKHLAVDFGKISEAKLELLYKACYDLSKDEFQQVVDNMIGNFKHKPTLNDFKEAAYIFLAKREKIVYPCNLCQGTGILSQEVEPGRPIAFRCNCKNGNQFSNFAYKNAASIAAAKAECSKLKFTLGMKHQGGVRVEKPLPGGFKRTDFGQAAKDLIDKSKPLPDHWDDF